MGDVDLRCAVRWSVVPKCRLPVRGWVLASDERPRDICGRRRSPVTLPGARKGRKPANAGQTYPPSPPTIDEMLALLETFGKHPAGVRDRALTVLLWRSGLRINEALSLMPEDLDRTHLTVRVKIGKGGKFRVSAMDPWAWQELEPWTALRRRYPPGPFYCIVEGRSKGGKMGSPAYRVLLKRKAIEAGITRRMAPHQLRHACACDLARGHVPLHLVQRELGHSSLATTARYLAGISPVELIEVIAARPAPGDTLPPVTKQP